MRKIQRAIITGILFIFVAASASAQRALVTDVQRKNLTTFSAQLKNAYADGRQKALSLAPNKNWAVRKSTANGGLMVLQGVNSLGFPVFLRTHNTEAAAATRTNAVQPGGELNLNLSGSSTILANKLAIWDGGTVYAGHQEFAGKTITAASGEAAPEDHSTHVAGTMIAAGRVAVAKGMAFGLNTLKSFDFDNDSQEMSTNAGGLLLSNHSYGDIAGWDDDTWYGLPGDTVDYQFGHYGGRTQDWDKIAMNAPYYLIVESAGNSHFYTGPAVGQTYRGYQSRTDQTIVTKGPRPASISSNDGYDVIATTGNAKNILTVGSVDQLPNGPVSAQSVVVSSFSSWGPTDDGRVKPDIMGMGRSVVSSITGNTAAYGTSSGTSMSSPNVTGSLVLLQEYYSQMHNDTLMRAATLKGLACHTAFDAGNTGPDYKFGWGVLDMRKAANTITNEGISSVIKESNLQQGQTQTYNVVATGTEPLIGTISWTDPEAAVTADGVVNDRTPKLVDDIDIRISGNGGIFTPWVLNPETPAAPATKGDNIRDNVEQVYIASPVAGSTYTVSISHKGVLRNGGENYSLIVTGGKVVEGNATETGNSISSFPSPATDVVNVAFKVKVAGALRLEMINMAGNIVYSTEQNVAVGNFNAPVNVSGYTTGIYALKIVSGGQIYTNKILVVH